MVIGYPDEAAKFIARNKGIDDIYDDAMVIAASIFGDHNTYSLEPWATVVFSLLASSYEIFLEIICLAGNGFGPGAQARLRTFFEHVVFAAHITKNHDAAERFIKFQKVEQKKELEFAIRVFANSSDTQLLATIKSRFDKATIEIAKMKQAFGSDFGRSWHDGVADMSKDLGWDHHFFYDYLLPNRYVHASPLATDRRVTVDEQMYFEGAPNYDLADEAVRSAMTVLLLAFAVAKDAGFGKIDKELDALTQDLIAYYSGRPNKHVL